MRFKSKYNIGDVVQFYNKKISDNDIGVIDSIHIHFNLETLKRETYKISLIKIKSDYCYNGMEVDDYNIHKKLNKKAFEKAFAEKCANYVAKGE